MNINGTVKNANILNPSNGGNRAVKVAEKNALRAVLDPRCQPFPLPADKYNTWKTIILRFDPSGLLGG